MWVGIRRCPSETRFGVRSSTD